MSQSLWEVRQVQVFAVSKDEAQEDEEAEEEQLQRGQVGGSVKATAQHIQEPGETLDRLTHKEGASFCTVLFPSTLFLCLSNTSVAYPYESFYSTTCLKDCTFIYRCSSFIN